MFNTVLLIVALYAVFVMLLSLVGRGRGRKREVEPELPPRDASSDRVKPFRISDIRTDRARPIHPLGMAVGLALAAAAVYLAYLMERAGSSGPGVP